MATTTTEVERAIRARQKIDPRNELDAAYIVGHPGEFDDETVLIATEVDDAYWARQEARVR